MDLKKVFEKKAPAPGRPEPVDEATFEERVLRSDEAVVVDMWAPWCGPCKVLGGLLEEVGPEFAGRLRILKLNVDENPVLAGRYGVFSIPTMLVFRGGELVDRKIGALPMNPLRAWLDKHATAAAATRPKPSAPPRPAAEVDVQEDDEPKAAGGGGAAS